ncbi:hypothetical protein [Nocardioides cynanchi]|uniref:hypothetical protein n=1 Tax=Nocardioides cynanchi TaxID=2558918 RepID=UPI001245AC76|nr:hypothetical protein [Nocardioides cynanchi]
MENERLVQTLEQRIAPHIDTWFPEQPHSGLEVRVFADRPSCVLLTVHLDGAEGPVALAKARRDSPGGPGAGSRPRLRREKATAEELTLLEWAGLTTIQETCGDVAGVGVVRPLLLMPEAATLVMSFVNAPTLRSSVLELSRLRPGRSGPGVAVTGCGLAGTWLRHFQERAPVSDRPIQQGTRDDVVERLRAYGAYLDSPKWDVLVTEGVKLATEVLPRELRLAAGHGDFAPRNMLMGDDRLTVIDPLPRWRVPVYDDLCRFLVGLRLIGEQVHTHGLAFSSTTLDPLEEAAIASYLPPEADRAGLRAYQLLILMDKWTAMIDGPRQGVSGRLTRRSAALADHLVRGEAERLLGLARAGA